MRYIGFLLAVALLPLGGCNQDVQNAVNTGETVAQNMTPDQIQAVAAKAGTVAAQVYCASQHPTPATAVKLQNVMNQINVLAANYTQGQFTSLLPQVQGYIATALPDPVEAGLAGSAAEAALIALDALAADNPTWQANSVKITSAVSGFTGAFSAYLSKYKPPIAAPAAATAAKYIAPTAPAPKAK